MELPLLPTINSSLNGIAALLLLTGRIFIAKGNHKAHKNCMVSALSVSAVFLASYLYYHYTAGHVVYHGTGALKAIYLLILIPHIILAVAMLPFIYLAFHHAFKGNFEKHKKIVKITWPVWMYVSVTGVIVYLMLYIF